ncbi:MAG TPA: hypothetical protein VFD98_12260, partial [Terracidiphilus sp.]|nr:hypothetical protein [Terracidiphilus sp.]
MDSAEKTLEHIRVYGWDWFHYHAEQRTSMFNYSLAAASLLAAGFGASIDKHPHLAAAIGIVGALVTWSFFLIDGRNDKLVRRGERVLKAFEATDFPNITQAPGSAEVHPMPGGILIVDEEGVRTRGKDNILVQYIRGTHRIHLRLIELIFFFAFLCGAAISIWRPDAFQLTEPPVAENVKNLSDQVARLNASLQVMSDRIAASSPQGGGVSQPAPSLAAPPVSPANSNDRH